jgi:hypothetical protein
VAGAVGRADGILGLVKLTRTPEISYLLGTRVNTGKMKGEARSIR